MDEGMHWQDKKGYHQDGEVIKTRRICLHLPSLLPAVPSPYLGASWLFLAPSWQNMTAQNTQGNLLHSCPPSWGISQPPAYDFYYSFSNYTNTLREVFLPPKRTMLGKLSSSLSILKLYAAIAQFFKNTSFFK